MAIRKAASALVGNTRNRTTTRIQKFGRYRSFGHRLVQGWLKPEVIDIVVELDSAQRRLQVRGAVAEIGVHHARFFIPLTLLQDPGEKSIAIDLFDQQDINIERSGKGNLKKFENNVKRWSDLSSVVTHHGDSTELSPGKLTELAGGQIRLFSIDGGHTAQVVCSDMKLAEETLCDGGVAICDDVFNEGWPGVSDGTRQYMETGRLIPFAIGFNKVFFAFPEFAVSYRSLLAEKFGRRYLISARRMEFAGHSVMVLMRVPRRLRPLARQNETARAVHEWVQARRKA